MIEQIKSKQGKIKESDMNKLEGLKNQAEDLET